MKNNSPAALRARIKVLEAEVAALRAASAGRACAHCGEPFHPHNATARTCSPRCRVAMHRSQKTQKTRTRSVIAKRAAATRKLNRMRDAYFEKFPDWSGMYTPAVDRAMQRALETGQDQPLLIKQRKANERNEAEYDAKIAAEHAQPFTADLEKHYTARVKNRTLREGDCERPWQNYSAYREANANTVEPLTADDLQYLGPWTACPAP